MFVKSLSGINEYVKSFGGNSNNILSLSILFGVINFLFILMIGIILNFYSTQG